MALIVPLVVAGHLELRGEDVAARRRRPGLELTVWSRSPSQLYV